MQSQSPMIQLIAFWMENGAFRMNSKISFNIGIMGTRFKAFLEIMT